MAGTIWFWNQPAAGGGDEILAAATADVNDTWYVTQIDSELEIEAFWGGMLNDTQTTLDSFLAVTVGPPASDVIQAVQDYNEDYQFNSGLDEDWYGNVYGFPDQALDVVAQLFPPAAVEPVETFASQPHYGEWLWAEEQTEDYGPPPEQLEPFAPPEIIVPGLIAVQPHYGELPIPAEETEDYANESTLDVTPAFFPVPVEPIETLIAQPLAEQPWFPDQDTEDYHQLVEQNEPFAPPEVSTVELLAAQPHFGEWVWPEDQTEDYQAESSLDVSPQFFQVAAEPIETFAAQPHYGEWVWEDPQIEDYKADVVLDITPQLFPPVIIEPDETFAAQPHFGEWIWPAEGTEDYSNDSTLDVSPLTFEAPAPIAELLTANYSTFYGTVEALESDGLTIEDYGTPTTIDTAFLVVVLSAAADPVKGPTRKLGLSGTSTSTAPLTSPTQTTGQAGTDTETQELAGPPRVDRIGTAGNDLEEV